MWFNSDNIFPNIVCFWENFEKHFSLPIHTLHGVIIINSRNSWAVMYIHV